MRRGLLLAWFLSVALLTSGSGVAQVGGSVSTGAAAGGNVDQDGASYHAGLSSSRVFVDPLLVQAFEVHLNQVAILVAEPAKYALVVGALEQLSIPFHAYDELHMVSVLLPKDRLGDVQGIPGLVVIYRNEYMEPLLDRAADYVGAPVVWNTYKVTGQGVTIMVVDSGVDGTHPDVELNRNLIQNVQSMPGANAPLLGKTVENVPLTDKDGHGTHVASIAAGLARAPTNPGIYKGIGWNAKIVGFAAGIQDPTTGDVSFESQTVLEAFNYAIAKQKQYNISIVSNSWGANGDFDLNSPINIATLQMYKKGMLVTFAAGNEGTDGDHTLNKYSVAPWVLSVAAGDYLNQIARFSSVGTDPALSGLGYDHPDIVAPGVGITAARALAQSPTSGPGGYYSSKSGTSMATPIVSGIAAMLLASNPRLSPDNLMDILTATATPLRQYDVWEAGAGYVNALKAYQLAEKTPGDRASFLAGKVKYAGRESGDAKLERDAVSVGYGAGSAVQLESGAQSISEFAESLGTSAQGLVFLGGTAVLTIFAFGLGRRRAPD